MGFWNDLFGGSDQQYPIAPAGPVSAPCGTQPFAPPEREGLFNKLFAPKQLAYPLRACAPTTTTPAATLPPAVRDTVATVVSSASAGAGTATDAANVNARNVAASGAVATTSSGSSSPSNAAGASSPTPVTVVISLPNVAGLTASAPTSTEPATTSTREATTNTNATSAPASTTVASTPVSTTVPASQPSTTVQTPAQQPVASTVQPPTRPIALPMLATSATRTKRLHAFVFNPEFTPQYRTAHEQLIESMIDEVISARMITRDATPILFTVPEGCDTFDLLYGPVEVNPGFGCPADLDQIVTVGEAQVTANVSGINRPLAPGDQLVVTVPWRAASWVELEPGRLRCQVVAQFYKAPSQPTDGCSAEARGA